MKPPETRPVSKSKFPRTAPPARTERPPADEEGSAPAPPPPVKECVEPPKGKQFSCPACGGSMRYKPGMTHLVCEHCGTEKDVPQSAEQVQELCFKTYFETGRVSEGVLEGAERETRCPGCGAMVVLPQHVAADFCPFCASQLTNPVEEAHATLQPGGVIPFQFDKREAHARFHVWAKSRWFAPNALKQLDQLEKLNGVYVPYWTYDAMTFSFYAGQRGITYTTTVGFGRNRRTVTRTRWTPVSGRVDHFFDDLPVCASNTLPESLVDKLERWNTNAAKPYTKEFLSGYRTERYQVSCEHGFDIARKRMDDLIHNLVRQRIGGDRQRITSITTQYDGIKFKLMLMPVWIAAYKYGDKTYRVLVNGQTGEVQGERPYSWIKITIAAVLALAVLLPLLQFLITSM